MKQEDLFDCIIVGGGLAGSLLLYALKSKNPEAKIILLEKQDKLGGNHTWCFHQSDIPPRDERWIRQFISKSWSQYEVLFPEFKRIIPSFYHCIKSCDLHSLITNNYPTLVRFEACVEKVNDYTVELEGGEILNGRCIVDARGWKAHLSTSPAGFQKFAGLDVKLKNPHHLSGARLKDCRVDQVDGYRFIYVLPWNKDEILVEDTYYSNNNHLDVSEIKKRILEYIKQQGWEVETILREEVGCLPLVSSENVNPNEEAVIIGARSGLYQPVTGYTLPQTFRAIGKLVSLEKFDTQSWKEALKKFRKDEDEQMAFFYFLNKILFNVAIPQDRYRVLQHFYRLPQSLIENFYKGKLSYIERIRIFIGRPPVPLLKFLKYLMSTKS